MPDDLPTVFRVLKVKDVPNAHVIRNMLLDWTSAERLLLVDVRPSPLCSHNIALLSTLADEEVKDADSFSGGVRTEGQYSEVKFRSQCLSSVRLNSSPYP